MKKKANPVHFFQSKQSGEARVAVWAGAWIVVCLLSSANAQNLQGNLSSGTYQAPNILTNCGTSCVSVTLNSNANVTLLAGSQIILGPGFTAAAPNGSTSLVAMIASQVAPPTFSPNGGTYTSAKTVTISTTTPGATISYTTDGTTPSQSNGTWGNSVTISSTHTLQAIAFKSGMIDSNVTSATYTINSGVQISISTGSPLNGGTIGLSYSQSFSATGGSSPYTWSLLSGSLPQGLMFSTTGALSGTPTTSGSFSFWVQVSDTASHTASGSFTLFVNAIVTEINLGFIPIDQYGSQYSSPTVPSGLNTNNVYFPNCPTTFTVQQCYALMFNNNPSIFPYSPNNYIAQGVTGARFIFGLMGGGYSTAWNPSGAVQSQWTANLRQFLSDLKSYGLIRVTPQPAVAGVPYPGFPSGTGWTDPFITTAPTNADCTGNYPLMYMIWLPFGEIYDVQGNPPVPNTSSTGKWGYSNCQGYDSGYNIANNNPHFWGWSPFFNLVDTLFNQIQLAGLQLAEFDMYNEISLGSFTVQASFIYDSTHSYSGAPGTTDVLGTVRNSAFNHGFNTGVVTYSTPVTNPTSVNDCGTVYGPSAILLAQAELVAAIAGSWSYFGSTNPTVNYGLPCGGTLGTAQVPMHYTQPTLNDIHAYPCVGACQGPSSPDATPVAQIIYSDAWSLLNYWGLTGNILMVGETHPGQNTYAVAGCSMTDPYTTTMASQNVNGFNESTLHSNHASLTTMRIWLAPGLACYSFPTLIAPPY